MKKFVLLILICLLLIQPTSAFASSHVVIEPNQYSSSTNTSDIIPPYKDITGWRFKNINGRLHKRLYNYSKQTWIGNWIPC